MAGYISQSEYTENIIEVLNGARLSGTPTVLWGSPGTGKTSLVVSLAERNNIPCKIVLGSIMDPTDLSGLPAIENRVREDGSEYSVTRNTCPDWADDLIQAGKGILFLDEINNSAPAVQSAMLSLLQGRKVGQYTLPDDVWILAAANEPEDATDGYDLAAPMANRILHINWNPESSDWFQGMIASWGEDVSDSVREERIKIVSFLKTYPNLLQSMPENESEAGKAWPSRRSWDNAAKTLGSIPDASNSVRNTILKGLVGEVASNQFFTWERSLELPTHEDVMKDPSAINWKTYKADAVVTIVNRTIGLMTADQTTAAFAVLTAIAANGQQDIATSYVKDMLVRVNQLGGKMSMNTQLAELATYAAKAKLS